MFTFTSTERAEFIVGGMIATISMLAVICML